MNRCPTLNRLLRAAALLGAALLSAPTPAQWQQPQRIPPIPAHAQRGVLEVTDPPEALLDGQPARLAPGARIRDASNLLVLSGALTGRKHVVRYTRDTLGLLHEIWMLTPTEMASEEPEARQTITP